MPEHLSQSLMCCEANSWNSVNSPVTYVNSRQVVLRKPSTVHPASLVRIEHAGTIMKAHTPRKQSTQQAVRGLLCTRGLSQTRVNAPPHQFEYEF